MVEPLTPDRLRVRLLGELELRCGDAVVALPPSRRTRALLGYLVAQRRPQSRTALCDLLWDGSEDPRASLRWSLTKLRAAVDDPQARRLAAGREHVAFEAMHCEIDLLRVESLLADGIDATPLDRLEQAAADLRGDFLSGLDLPACYRFQNWCLAERERWGELRRAVLARLVDALRDDPVRALPYGHAMVAADPLGEVSHATLVGLLDAAGRYPDAEQHYAWARSLLQREIALPAGGALDEAIRTVRRARRELGAAPEREGRDGPQRQDADARPDATPPGPTRAGSTSPAASAPGPTVPDPIPSTPLPAPPPLVGRDDPRRTIAALLSRSAPSPLLLFAGEPGIGKTRMLDQVGEDAVAAGYRVIRGRCFEAETLRPYGLWTDAFRGLPPDAVPTPVRDRAAPLLDPRSGAGPEGSRERLIDAAADLLRGLATQQPLALLLDDLHWIDEGSAALLHFAVRTLARAPIVIAGAARAGEIDDNPGARHLLQSLLREARLRRIDLRPLTAAQARVLLAGSTLEADEAVRATGGNPMYLLELAGAARQGALDRDDGLDDPPRLDALIDERLGALDEPALEMLGWAAAFGGEVRPELLAEAIGVALPEVLAWLSRYERRGLVVPTGHGQYDFAHGLVRQGLYRRLSPPRRRAIHLRIARVLDAASAEAPALHGDVVHHAGLAGDRLLALRACVAAGRHCLRVFANGQAAQVADRGLAQLDELPPGPERTRLEVELLRLRVASAAGTGGRRLPALAERIERAARAAQALALHAEAAAGWEILAFWRQQSGDPDLAEQATMAAERMTRRADATTRCLQLANTARCLLDIEADPARGRALLDEAVAGAEALGLEVMEIAWARGLVARARGELDAARSFLAHAVDLARLGENHWREYECTVWLAIVALEREDLPAVERLAGSIAAAAARMGEPQAPFAAVLGALARLRAGDGSAWAPLEAGLDALRALDDKAHLAYALNEAAPMALRAGRRDLAGEMAAEALAAARAVRRPTEVAVALARLAASAPDARQAADWLAQADGAEIAARGSTALAAAATAIPTGVPTMAPTDAT